MKRKGTRYKSVKKLIQQNKRQKHGYKIIKETNTVNNNHVVEHGKLKMSTNDIPKDWKPMCTGRGSISCTKCGICLVI
jgi:hypothetical protein